MMRLNYVTSNRVKFEEAQIILASPNIELIHSHIHLDELQGTPKSIIEHKVIQAFNLLNEAVIVDDVSVSLEALHGLPGPYIRPFLEALGDDGFWDLVKRYENRRISATCSIAYMHSKNLTPLFFDGTVHGTVVEPRGATRHGPHSWNAFTQPDGSEKTMAQMSLEEMSRISPRGNALRQLKNYLLTHPEAL